MDRSTINKLLFLISFLEGGAVMVIELIGAKIIAPYYGTSLYVWSSVLGVTLGALALGYFLGGYLSNKYEGYTSLFAVLFLGSIFTALCPIVAPTILNITEGLGVRLGSLVSVGLYLLPPLVCMGCVSPIIIQLITKSKEESGKTAGLIYSVSTVGGILATFFAGFYLIPIMGIQFSAFLTAGILGSLSLLYFFIKKNNTIILTMILIFVAVQSIIPKNKAYTNAETIYKSTGILGEWEVLDVKSQQDKTGKLQTERKLLLNGIDQTYTQLGFEPLSLWTYPHKITAYSSIKPAGSKALLLGMGGGSIAYELLAMGFELDIVEIDERIRHIAKHYFKYDDKKSNLIIDDARHYIRNVDIKYDVVIMDIVLGEVQPAHVLSLEGFEDLRAIMKEDGLVIVNFQGTLYDEEYSLGGKSIFKTMREAGFYTEYYTNPQIEGEEINYVQDIFFIGSPTKLNFKDLLSNPRYNEWFPYDSFYYKNLVSEKELDLSLAEVLIDDKPKLELINSKSVVQWRKNKIEENLKVLRKVE